MEGGEDQFIKLNSGQIFQDYAQILAEEGKYKEALSVYAVSIKQTGINKDTVRNIGEHLVAHHSRCYRQRRTGLATDPWSCASCAGVLVEPVTLGCGHSSCKKCILKDICEMCKKCGYKYKARENDPVNEAEYIKASILISDLVRKYWSKELKAVVLRNEGNKLFQRGDTEGSILKYSEAFALAPTDHLLMSNRSHAYYKMERYHEALADAARTIKLRQDWGKGYFRRGMALHALGQHEDALVAFFECLVLEGTASRLLKNEIYTVLENLIAAEPAGEEEESTPTTSDLAMKMLGDSKGGSNLMIPRHPAVCRALDKVGARLPSLSTLNYTPVNRHIEPAAVDAQDFECSLCFRMLWQPVTTNCGHTYCKACLDRSLDHRRECPLCKTELEVLTEKLGINEFVEQTVRRMLPSEFLERQRIFEDEISDLANARTDGRVEVPVFVCTASYPTISCPLHVFEPRYRLMIRRAMENGTREFGMCTNEQNKEFSDYGTMLEIRDIQYFSDGRSVVDTMGSRRFRVVERSTKDGYHTAVVEFISDEIPEGNELAELKTLHNRIRTLAVGFFQNLYHSVKEKITSNYGPMPRAETDYWLSAAGPAWAWWILAILPLETSTQTQILSQTKLKKRLEAIGRILVHMKRQQPDGVTE